MIYVVIPVFNRWSFTQACLESLQQQTYRNFKIIVVDHGSTDNTSKLIEANYPEVILLQGDNSMWWTSATNLGIKYALKQSDRTHILTLNNDLTVDPNYLLNINKFSQIYPKALIGSISLAITDRKNICFAGTKWNKWTAKYTPCTGIPTDNSEYKLNSDLLPGRGTLIPISAFMDLGLFDDTSFPHYLADEDFSNTCKNNGYLLLLFSSVYVCSETEATGLNNTKYKTKYNYWNDVFFSERSPVKLKNRWNWAWKNTPIPPLYFMLDISRIIISKILK